MGGIPKAIKVYYYLFFSIYLFNIYLFIYLFIYRFIILTKSKNTKNIRIVPCFFLLFMFVCVIFSSYYQNKFKHASLISYMYVHVCKY